MPQSMSFQLPKSRPINLVNSIPSSKRLYSIAVFMRNLATLQPAKLTHRSVYLYICEVCPEKLPSTQLLKSAPSREIQEAISCSLNE